MKKNGIVFIGLVFFLNTLYGCSGLQKEPIIKNYFDLEIKLADSPSQKLGNNDTLIVKEFFINPAFDSYSFVYRMTENEYITDFYNEFISYPAKLITEKITETLYFSSYFTPAPTDMKQDITYRLSGKITRLYADFQDTDDPKAIIEIRMTLEKNTGPDFQAISSKTYLTEEPILSRTPAQLIDGWNTGLAKIVAQFINDFQTPAP